MTRTLLALSAAVALAGCISFGAEPPPSLLTLTAAARVAPGTAVTAESGKAVTVLVPRSTHALATTRVPVQASPTSIAYVKDAQWVEMPTRLFQQLLSETIEAQTGRQVLSPRQFAHDPGIRVSGQLTNFGVDAATRSAVVTYDAAISRGEGAATETRRFEARVPVARIDADTVAVGLNEAANQVAAEVATWIGR
jgi:cholesterol transport system auxiliary component